MKVLKNKFNEEKETLKVFCDHCGSELEVEDDDVEYGSYGVGFVTCPCWGERTDLAGKELELSVENLRYSIHYYNFEGGVDVSDEEIDALVKECINKFDPDNENDWVRLIGSGNTMVFVFKMVDEYEIYVCKNYQETSLPIKYWLFNNNMV